MPRDGNRTSASTERTRLSIMFAALVLLIVGGFLAGGYVISLMSREVLSLDSAVVFFLIGLGCIVTALVLIWRRF